ncbi:RNA-dependent RNA polymerase [Venustampulla echinocandica]|uniref:RNA-dependent RNA polymerase n=1 Tax=Venustampulla echinocandica TaxID=2656787 RepID=A0A370TKN1_9HELO|nr:RNA-dependent RNA polymerase [Venustampulla echinocandica]RDL36081.1 RNA-dependent RNA polymerase [Venustampulla echinocandica]
MLADVGLPVHTRPYMDHTTIQRPIPRRGGYRGAGSQQPPPPVMLKPQHKWSRLPELTVRISNLLPSETTWNIWRNFKTQGNISFIEIFEGSDGKREGRAKVRFSPPPRDAFWATNNNSKIHGAYMIRGVDDLFRYRVSVEMRDNDQKRGHQIQSPIHNHIFYDQKMTLSVSTLHFGLMMQPQSMMLLQTVKQNSRSDELTFIVDLVRKRLTAEFMFEHRDARARDTTTDLVVDSRPGKYDRMNKYMFQIPFEQLKVIHRVNSDDGSFKLAISLDSPPQFYRKRDQDKDCHPTDSLVWSEFDDGWFRQTDIVYNPWELRGAVVTLHKPRPVIDIGRWTTYLFEFNQDKKLSYTYDEIKRALQDYNVEIITADNLDTVPAQVPELWSLIDHQRQITGADLQPLDGPTSVASLPFEVRYQLEVCISREMLNEYNISQEFITALADMAATEPSKARNILEYVAEQDKRIYDPMSIFEDREALAFSTKTEIPHYCAYSRKATITPSTIYFSSPTVETTNRVLRRYASENQDGRFLRVQFTDELFEGKINFCAKQRNDEVFTRVFRTLQNGIQIGDRHYEFLAFGNSQFREHGAYFFCPTEHLSCNDIRNWMGNFSHINVVAKYAARLGQCFSTTRAINGLSAPKLIPIPDIERGEYCFTDGVGKISPFLAQMICAELGLRSTTIPSAFQFRLGGCKGVLVVWPEARDSEVHMRRSQQKFTAVYNGLEIIRCSRFSCASLNRQTITILSCLGVPDRVFLDMMSEQLANYQNAMSDNDLAVSLLLRYIDDNQMTINIATMIRNGFMAQRDPFVISLLHLWRSWSIKLLKEKAKIIVEKGAFVLGCVDETGILKGYNRPTVAQGTPFLETELPEIFIQVPSKDDPSVYNVIEGICLVGRNPSLHPGDLRVVKAVNVPALHHLRDVVVFPSTGERDIPSMCSGGDLDGDDYFVIWDKELQPPEWNCEPMNYAAQAPRTQSRPVEVQDLMKFFVRFIKNDALPTIALAHLAQSDYLDRGVKDPRCLELAALHSKAVDYSKSGHAAEMQKRLRPRQWPHFMDKGYRRKDTIYESQKILGQLFNKVESVDFVPQWNMPFDRRILSAYKLEDSILKSARQIKSKYDVALRRIMAQQEIKTEFEVWSTFVLSRPRVGSDYKMQEQIGIISEALKDQFRAVCIDKAGGKDFDVLGPFVAGMYKVTKEEVDIALAECRATKMVGTRRVPKRKMESKYMPLISFPWLFEKQLGRIATGIAGDDIDDIGLQTLTLKTDHPHAHRGQAAGGAANFDDYIRREDGVIVHRGEELDLFRDMEESEDAGGSADSDSEEGLFPESAPTTMDKNGVISWDSEIIQSPVRSMQSESSNEGLAVDATDDLAGTPLESPIDANYRFSEDEDLLDFSEDVDIVEEVVDLEIEESAMEKLARLMAS